MRIHLVKDLAGHADSRRWQVALGKPRGLRFVGGLPVRRHAVVDFTWMDLQPLVTHSYSLDDTAEAFEVAESKAGGAIKVLVTS